MATVTAPPPRLHANHNHAHPQDNYDIPPSPAPSLGPHRNSGGNRDRTTSTTSTSSNCNRTMSTSQPHRELSVQRPAAASRASISGKPPPSSAPASSSSTTMTATPLSSHPPAPPAPPLRRMPTHPKHPSASSTKLLTQASSSPSHASLNTSSIAGSPSPSQPSNEGTQSQQVKTTYRLEYSRDQGILNHYIVDRVIGKGQHGQVFYGVDMANSMRPVAIKSCFRKNVKDARIDALRKNRDVQTGGMVRASVFGRIKDGKIVKALPGERLYNQLEGEEKKILREIAMMKKCKHGQVVQLYEVLDDIISYKIFMVMEFMGGGEIKWQDRRKNPVLAVDQVRRICRDVVLGLEYLHHQGIIHRDIKPANLLWTANRKNVKITDFGVSHFSYAQRLSALRAGRAWRANASTDPNSQPSALFPSSQHGGASKDEDEASALRSLVTEEGESFDPIMFDTLNDAAYGLSRQAGTPTFLAPEIVWEYREGILDSLSGGSGAWVGSLSNRDDEGSGAVSQRQVSQVQDGDGGERLMRTMPLEGSVGTTETIGHHRVQPQPRSASAGDFSSGPALALPESATSSTSRSEARANLQNAEPSLSTLSSMDIVRDSDSDEGEGVIRIHTLPPTPLPDENPMERQHEQGLRPHSDDNGQERDSQVGVSRAAIQAPAPSASAPAPVPSTSTSSTSPTPFSPSPSTSSKQRTTLQDFPRPPITKSIDVWALGVTLFCLLTGRTPWDNPENEFVLFRYIHVNAITLPETVGIDELRIPPPPSLPSLPASSSSDTASSAQSEAHLRRVSLPLGPVSADKPIVFGPSPPPRPAETFEGEENEGEIVVKLLAGLLEKDYRKRMTLEQVKRLPWITRDIADREAWLRETSPYLHDPVRVSADEVNVAVTALKFKWDARSFIRRITGRIKGKSTDRFKHGLDEDLRPKPKAPTVREGRSKRKEEPVVRDYGVQTDRDVTVETQRNTKLNRNSSRTRRLLGHLTGDHKDPSASKRKRIARKSSAPTTSILNKSPKEGANVNRAGTVSGVLTLAETSETVNRRRALPDLSIETRSRLSVSDWGEGHQYSDNGIDTPRASLDQASASTSNATSPRSAGYTSEEILDEDEEMALNRRQEEEERERMSRQQEKGKGKEVAKEFDSRERVGSIGSKLWHLIGGKNSQSSSRSSMVGDATPGSSNDGAVGRKKSRHGWGRSSGSASLAAPPASASMGSSRLIRMGRRSADEFKTAGISQMPYSSSVGRGGVYHSSTVGLSGMGSGFGGDDDNAFPMLSDNQRASSWGEVAEYYHRMRRSARSQAAIAGTWDYGDVVIGHRSRFGGNAHYRGDSDDNNSEIDFDGEADGGTEYGVDEDTLMVGAGGVLSNPVSVPSSPNSLSGVSVDGMATVYRDQYQQTVQSAHSSLYSPIGDDSPRAPSLISSPVIHPAGSPHLGQSSRAPPPSMLPLPLPLLQQAEHLLHSSDVPAIPNPAAQDVGGVQSRRRPSHGHQSPKHQHQLSSPLAQTPLNVDDDDHDRATPPNFEDRSRHQHEDVFEDSDDESNSESSSKGRRVYGHGSRDVPEEEFGDDDGECSSGSSSEHNRPIEVKRRRPSESMARSSSQMRRSESEDEHPSSEL